MNPIATEIFYVKLCILLIICINFLLIPGNLLIDFHIVLQVLQPANKSIMFIFHKFRTVFTNSLSLCMGSVTQDFRIAPLFWEATDSRMADKP